MVNSIKNSSLLWFGAGKIASEFTLLNTFVDYGHVWGLRRKPDAIAEGMAAVGADFSDERCLAAIDRVAVTAFPVNIVVTLTPPARSDDGYRAGYVEASRNLIAELKRLQISPRRVLFVSSTSVYGQDEGQWLDETSASIPGNFSGQRLLEAEQLWHNSGWPVCCVRFSGIYGPGRFRLLDQVSSSRATNVNASFTNRIHQTDCARVIDHLLRCEQLPDVLIATDDAPVVSSEVKVWLAQALGVVSGAQSKAQIPKGKRLSNKRLRNMGFELMYPSFREGYPAIVEQYQQRMNGVK